MSRKGNRSKRVEKQKVSVNTDEAEPIGLGDSIDNFTKATGIKKIVKKIFPDCGCKERKEWANKKFPYVNSKTKCMTKEQFDWYGSFRDEYIGETKQISIPSDEMKKVISLYNSIFQVNVRGCAGCNAGTYIKKLDVVYNKYKLNNNK